MSGVYVEVEPDPDGDALWWRFGAPSYGLLGLPQYGRADAKARAAARDRIASSALVPVGVNSRAAQVLELFALLPPMPAPPADSIHTPPTLLARERR
ncbi:MAG: hypothetical protein WCF36_11925 [Candidatus Nanopelagicales bacterium]